MEIEAIVKLRYCTGESISGGPERLDMVVKFKDPNKRFKQKIVKTLHSTYSPFKDQSYDEYLQTIENWLSDNFYHVRKEAEGLVRKYFEEQKVEKDDLKLLKLIDSKVNQFNNDKIKITVKIDN